LIFKLQVAQILVLIANTQQQNQILVNQILCLNQLLDPDSLL